MFFSIRQRWVLSGAEVAYSVGVRAGQPEGGVSIAGRTKKFFSPAEVFMQE
jgi:hypothetical protein